MNTVTKVLSVAGYFLEDFNMSNEGLLAICSILKKLLEGRSRPVIYILLEKNIVLAELAKTLKQEYIKVN
jgi:hypothetical protein